MSSDGMNPDPGASQSGPAVQVDALKPGELFDRRYRIVKKLGEGGMGEVYAAEHTTLQKRVAIKLLRAEIVANQEAVKRFRQEATSSSSIGHPNIIKIEDFADLPDGRIYLCMELLDGAPLNDLVSSGALDMGRLLNVIIQTGHGLSAAHAKGIVHRDMKPENIFVTHDAQGQDIPKILDFGIAKVAGNDGQNNLTRTGTIFGTPFYMAPEQALGGQIDGRVDIYAMGVICYEVFAGSLPFRGESFMGILTQHITTEPEPVAQRAAAAGRQLPPGLPETIGRAMAKDPNQRFQTMDELVQSLVQVYRIVAGSGMSAYMEAYQPPRSQMMAAGMPMPTGQGHNPAQMRTEGVGMGPGMTPPPMHGQQPPHMTPPPMHAQQQPPSMIVASSDSSMMMPAKKSSVGLIFAIIAIIAVIGGGIAVFIVMSKKSGDETASSGSGTGTGTDTPAVTIDAGSGGVTPKSDAPDAAAGKVNPAPPDAGSAVPQSTPDAAVAKVENPPDAGVAKVEPITVLVDASADGAQIFENGKKIDKAPAMIAVTPGEKRTLVLKKKGYKDATVVIDGARTKVKVDMDREKSGTGSGTGHTGSGTHTGTGTKEDPRKKLCREHPDDPRCMLEP